MRFHLVTNTLFPDPVLCRATDAGPVHSQVAGGRYSATPASLGSLFGTPHHWGRYSAPPALTSRRGGRFSHDCVSPRDPRHPRDPAPPSHCALHGSEPARPASPTADFPRGSTDLLPRRRATAAPLRRHRSPPDPAAISAECGPPPSARRLESQASAPRRRARREKQQIVPPSVGPGTPSGPDSPPIQAAPRGAHLAGPLSLDLSRMGGPPAVGPGPLALLRRVARFRLPRPPAPKPLGVVFGDSRAMCPPRRPIPRPNGLLRRFAGGLSGALVASGAQCGPSPADRPGAGRQCALWVRDAVRPAGAAAGRRVVGKRVTVRHAQVTPFGPGASCVT